MTAGPEICFWVPASTDCCGRTEICTRTQVKNRITDKMTFFMVYPLPFLGMYMPMILNSLPDVLLYDRFFVHIYSYLSKDERVKE